MKLAFGLVALMALMIASPVFAHDAAIGVDDPVELSDLDWVEFLHPDEYPFKGTFYIRVKNTSNTVWGDFHFKITSPWGQDISNVHFLDASMGGQDPQSSQSGLWWTIDNNVVGAEINLYYYNSPVNPGQIAWFEVYTDNPDHVDFGVCVKATPIPEPSSLAALASVLGAAGLAWRRKR